MIECWTMTRFVRFLLWAAFEKARRVEQRSHFRSRLIESREFMLFDCSPACTCKRHRILLGSLGIRTLWIVPRPNSLIELYDPPCPVGPQSAVQSCVLINTCSSTRPPRHLSNHPHNNNNNKQQIANRDPPTHFGPYYQISSDPIDSEV
jgi:hypothetical protein